METIEQIVAALKNYPDFRVVVSGHTSSRGDDEANRALSQARAEAVVAFIVREFAMDADRLRAIGYGASDRSRGDRADHFEPFRAGLLVSNSHSCGTASGPDERRYQNIRFLEESLRKAIARNVWTQGISTYPIMIGLGLGVGFGLFRNLIGCWRPPDSLGLAGLAWRQ